MDDSPKAHAAVPLRVSRIPSRRPIRRPPEEAETGIYESYLQALETATDYVSIGNQYLTSPEIVDAIVTAMQRGPDLQS